MIYVFYSELQRSFIKREVKKLVKSLLSEINDFNYLRVDAKEVSVSEIVEACQEVPMLEDKKVVVVEDAFFVSSTKSKEKINKDSDYDRLVKYIAKPNEQTDLILLVYADKLDARGKIYKALVNQNVEFKSFAPLKENEWLIYTNQLTSKSGILFDQDAVNELAKRTLNDRDRLLNEIEKLGLYKNHISLNDIVTFVNEPIEDKAFLLTNALLAGKTSDALFIYRDLKTKNMDPNALLIMLANQFRFMYMAEHLRKQGLGMYEIASKLNVKEFRVKMTLNSARAVRKNGLIKILDDLYTIDTKIKSGQIDRFVGFELFLVNFKKNYLSEL